MKLSIAIPTYNQSQYLKETILSAINQTYKPFEIVVYNDCSTDDTVKALDVLSKEISILKVYNQPTNKGIAKNKNECLKVCKGDYIILLDSDDLLHKTYAETLINLIEKHPDAGYAHGNVQEIDEYGNKTRLRLLSRNEDYINSENEIKRFILGMRVSANIILFKKEALKAINYLDGAPDYTEDYFTLSKIADTNFGNVFSSKILSSYRVWSRPLKTRVQRKLQEINGYRIVFDKVLIPALIKRNLNPRIGKQGKLKKAISQSKCLFSNYYSKHEKEEIKFALLKLSDSLLLKIYIFVYQSKFSYLFLYMDTIKANTKNYIKKIILKP
jgi:glycosyltransferase involved in cell wall biosynthesis